MTHVVEPAKSVLHLFPLKTLRWAAFVPALLIWLYSVVVCRFIGLLFPRLAVRMPWIELFTLWIKDGFKKIWEVSFGLIHAPISYHFPRSEVVSLAESNSQQSLTLEMINSILWTMVARKPWTVKAIFTTNV
jgi:hypothetical protein